jgi:hypothetical protein
MATAREQFESGRLSGRAYAISPLWVAGWWAGQMSGGWEKWLAAWGWPWAG